MSTTWLEPHDRTTRIALRLMTAMEGEFHKGGDAPYASIHDWQGAGYNARVDGVVDFKKLTERFLKLLKAEFDHLEVAI